jgi:hypothetical protein
MIVLLEKELTENCCWKIVVGKIAVGKIDLFIKLINLINFMSFV